MVRAVGTWQSDAAEPEHGGVDVSIQNAGIIAIARIDAMTEARMGQVVAANTKGVFLCSQEAIAPMRKQKRGGRLINAAPQRRGRIQLDTPDESEAPWLQKGATQVQ